MLAILFEESRAARIFCILGDGLRLCAFVILFGIILGTGIAALHFSQ